jgi:dTMP kinase
LKKSGEALDRIEQKGYDYHHRVREAFLKIANEQTDRVLLIDANRSPDDIFAEIYADCQRLLRVL